MAKTMGGGKKKNVLKGDIYKGGAKKTGKRGF